MPRLHRAEMSNKRGLREVTGSGGDGGGRLGEQGGGGGEAGFRGQERNFCGGRGGEERRRVWKMGSDGWANLPSICRAAAAHIHDGCPRQRQRHRSSTFK